MTDICPNYATLGTSHISLRSFLRTPPKHGHHRVTYVELLFDLVFVFAITQLSH